MMKSELAAPRQREGLLDFYRSCSMLFVFYHHMITILPNSVDFFKFNPFAEVFVLISGFMVGLVYLHRKDTGVLIDRAKRIFAAYFVVALPIVVGIALIGRRQEHGLLGGLLDVLTFRWDPTGIGILRFYGFMFLSLPVVLSLYKKKQLAVILVSTITFFLVTYLVFARPSIALNPLISFVVTLLQWQFIFMIGIFLGNLHRSKQLIGAFFYIAVTFIFLVGLSLDFYFGFPTNGEKFPYTFEKLINLLWTLPALLLILFVVYVKIKDWQYLPVILNIGKNSLISFLLSEIVRQFVKFLMMVFDLHPTIPAQIAIGLFGVLVVTFLMWLYSSRWREQLTVLVPFAGR